MDKVDNNGKGIKLGINGFGRIGKLSVWHHVGRKYFDEIVVNIGREAGTGFADIAHYVERDSTYGRLESFLHGQTAQSVISNIDEKSGSIHINGVKVTFLRQNRNPRDIDWRAHGVRLVLDTSGRFLDPTLAYDHPKGSCRGHLEAGAEKVVVSAPFKIKDIGADMENAMPKDTVTTVMGINENDYDPKKHKIISNASCSTTCLAHMMKPLLNAFGYKRILSASMATVHAATGSQKVLDRLPKSGTRDLRKNRSILNNIILTTTGAAQALRLVIPEIKQIGFIAESVRIPTLTGSLIILVLSFQEELQGTSIRREVLNNIYEQAAREDSRGYLNYSNCQNVSGDIIGIPRAATIIEAHETHTRTAELSIDLHNVPGFTDEVIKIIKKNFIKIPVTQAVIYGWYDNEMGSYVNILGDRTVSIAENM